MSDNISKTLMKKEDLLSFVPGQIVVWKGALFPSLSVLPEKFQALLIFLKSGDGWNGGQQNSQATKNLCSHLWSLICQETMDMEVRDHVKDSTMITSVVDSMGAGQMKVLLEETIYQVIDKMVSKETNAIPAYNALRSYKAKPRASPHEIATELKRMIARAGYVGGEPINAMLQVQYYIEALAPEDYEELHKDFQKQILNLKDIEDAQRLAYDRWKYKYGSPKERVRLRQVNVSRGEERSRKRVELDATMKAMMEEMKDQREMFANLANNFAQGAQGNGSFRHQQRGSGSNQFQRQQKSERQDRFIGKRSKSEGRCHKCQAFGHYASDKVNGEYVCPEHQFAKSSQGNSKKGGKRFQKNRN